MNDEILTLATAVLAACRQRGLQAATAESCTGGLVAAALTEIAGSSDVVDRGFVTYSNAAKQQMLGVPAQTLRDHGAVSRETAEAMARGALAKSAAGVVVAITGIAGPGSSSDKPAGRVICAAAARGGALKAVEMRYGDLGRAQVRHKSVLQALTMLREMAEHSSS